MATRSSHNKNNSAIKRIMQEAKELATDPCTDYTAAPLEDDLFEWHCTIRGSPQTEFEGGLYHFRIILPAEYPFRPPAIMMLTPSGRFELNTKICISFTNYHEELWQPAWGVRTAIIGLQGFFPLKGQAAVGVGSIEAPPSERKRLAKLSREWICPHCEISNLESLPDPPTQNGESSAQPPAAESKDNAKPLEGDSKPVQPLAHDTLPSHRPDTSTTSDINPKNSTSLHTPEVTSIKQSEASQVEENSGGTSEHIGQQQAIQQPAQPIHVPSVALSSARPPLLLDSAIAVLLILVAALLLRKVS